jgi:hypothetical protein
MHCYPTENLRYSKQSYAWLTLALNEEEAITLSDLVLDSLSRYDKGNTELNQTAWPQNTQLNRPETLSSQSQSRPRHSGQNSVASRCTEC